MSRTKEQLEAAQELRAIAPGLRVLFDAEGWPVIRGQRGQIEYHDGRELAVYTDRPKLFRKLFGIPGVRPHQTGDTEMRALFGPSALSQVARTLRARRRYQPSRAQLENLAAGTGRRRLTKRPQNEPARGGWRRPLPIRSVKFYISARALRTRRRRVRERASIR